MGKIYYYYDPVVQTNDYHDRFAVNYYETNGKQKVWAGRLVESTPTAALYRVRNLVSALNKPRPLFGCDGRIAQWFYWRAAVRNQKKS
jgi:hypothetical protein